MTGPRLERAVSVLMAGGVAASSALIAAGVGLHWTGWAAGTVPAVSFGVLVLVAVPALRLVFMAAAYLRARDRTHLAITLTVLALVVLTAVVGALAT